MAQPNNDVNPDTLLEPDLERELLRAYIDSANDGIFVVCDEMKFLVANDLLADWLGIPEEELVLHGQRIPILEYLGAECSEKLFQQQFAQVLSGQSVRFELELTPPGAETRWTEISMNRVGIDDLVMVIGVLRDVTERKQLINSMAHNASHDDLTGLYNRREFQLKLNTLFEDPDRSSRSHVLMYIDLDQLKIVNDTSGHRAGDELMRQVAAYIQRVVPSGNILARLGGDEFGIIVSDCDVDQALAIAEEIRDRVSAFEFHWHNQSFKVSICIGVCAIDDTHETPEAVLNAADAACYVAKDKGRNRVQLYFGGEDCTRKRKEMSWVPRIEQALKEDRLELHYQRIISPDGMDSESCAYIEILLRLIDESGDLVFPGAFFPAAERYNMMPSIDRWVVEQLLIKEPHRWMDLSKPATADNSSPVHCGINLSGASINDDAFLAFLNDTLHQTSVPHSAICFEITETVAISNLARATEVMCALKEKGCRFALDDFGKGMSSFGYLRSLPVDYLKIDGALVKEIINDDVAYTMVEAISRIAHAMNIKTIAEFVENDQILSRLRTIGVDYVQGYGIHTPEHF